jgi:hypothetical protein
MTVKKGQLVRYRKQLFRVLEISKNKKEAWIGIGVQVSKLKKVI